MSRPPLWSFVRGREYVYANGKLLLGWRLAWWRIQRAVRGLVWWHSRTVVAAVNEERGIITLADERWSWLRWRWVRR